VTSSGIPGTKGAQVEDEDAEENQPQHDLVAVLEMAQVPPPGNDHEEIAIETRGWCGPRCRSGSVKKVRCRQGQSDTKRW
jgi:hypothetical protein